MVVTPWKGDGFYQQIVESVLCKTWGRRLICLRPWQSRVEQTRTSAPRMFSALKELGIFFGKRTQVTFGVGNRVRGFTRRQKLPGGAIQDLISKNNQPLLE